jgi:hypothetical protein
MLFDEIAHFFGVGPSQADRIKARPVPVSCRDCSSRVVFWSVCLKTRPPCLKFKDPKPLRHSPGSGKRSSVLKGSESKGMASGPGGRDNVEGEVAHGLGG